MNARKLIVTALFAATTMVAAHAESPTLPPDIEAKVREKFAAFSTTHGALFEKLDPNDYRHPYERKVVSELYKDQKVKDLLPEAERLAAEFNKQYHQQHMLTGVLCSETQFPEIYKMAQENAAALQMKGGFKVYVMNSASINAYTWSIDENNYGVAIFSGLIRSMNREQLRYILGHEMGHVKSRHILHSILVELYYKKYEKLPAVFSLKDGKDDSAAPKNTVKVGGLGAAFADMPPRMSGDLIARMGIASAGPARVTETEYNNMVRFQQAAEYSSDRAGAVASGVQHEAMLGLVKLASGHTGDLGGFDMESYLKQIETVLATMSQAELRDMMAAEGSHAFTLMRVGELDLFFKSPEFGKAVEGKGGSIFREVMSAEYQIATVLVEALDAKKKFFTGTTASELNALERRLKEKEFADLIDPRQAADAVLAPLISDTIFEIGLTNAQNGAFDIYEIYARMKRTGVPIKPLTEKLIERIKFELTGESLTPEQKAELERKLKVATEIKDLKPNKPAGDANASLADADLEKK
jgi:hypothetical protein